MVAPEPVQKLEWVTPEISLMEGGCANGSGKRTLGEELTGVAGTSIGNS